MAASAAQRWVDSDGNVRYGPRPPPQRDRRLLWLLPIIIAFVAWRLWAPKFPDACTVSGAALIETLRDSQFVRTYADASKVMTRIEDGEVEPLIDSGGDYGCTPEREDDDDDLKAQESHRVTRCSTTVCALTRYLCGEGAERPRGGHMGLHGLRKTVTERWSAGQTKGKHARHLYRISLSVLSLAELADAEQNRKSTRHTGLSHVWVVAANEDGTFYWLQSFISQYSLYTWTKSPANYNITKEELVRRLRLTEKLTALAEWDAEADDIYQELFRVRMTNYWFTEGLEDYGRYHKTTEKFSTATHALIASWEHVCNVDEACRLRAKNEGAQKKAQAEAM